MYIGSEFYQNLYLPESKQGLCLVYEGITGWAVFTHTEVTNNTCLANWNKSRNTIGITGLD